MEEAGTLTWRDHISQNIETLRLNLGHSFHTYFIFNPYNFQLLNLRQYRNIANVPKLGFDFPGVSPNQISWYRSLKFSFYDEKNPILVSLKNSSSVEIPNFHIENWKCSESNSASTERCALQWRVILSYFCWWIVERDTKIKNPLLLKLYNVLFSG